MIKKAWERLYGWAVTLRIKYFEPETYVYLTDWKEFDEDDFFEVGPPE